MNETEEIMQKHFMAADLIRVAPKRIQDNLSDKEIAAWAAGVVEFYLTGVITPNDLVDIIKA